MARPSEFVGVCDLFGDQLLNVSASGSGDRTVFERNVRSLVPEFDRLRVFARSSADLTATDVGAGQRFFHVDGGHLFEEALGDLRLGAQVLHDQGVIVVDDPFRPEWPGVTEAVLKFLDDEPGFVPLVLGFNKLVLIRRSAREPYAQALGEPETVWSSFDRLVFRDKTLPLHGEPVTIFYIPTYRQLPELTRPVARMRHVSSAVRRRLVAVARRSRRAVS
jgi:hypothetical protein